jgi:hypothetical protein
VTGRTAAKAVGWDARSLRLMGVAYQSCRKIAISFALLTPCDNLLLGRIKRRCEMEAIVRIEGVGAVFTDAIAECGGVRLSLLSSAWGGLFAIEKNVFAFDTLKANLVDAGARHRYHWSDWLEQRRRLAARRGRGALEVSGGKSGGQVSCCVAMTKSDVPCQLR